MLHYHYHYQFLHWRGTNVQNINQKLFKLVSLYIHTVPSYQVICSWYLAPRRKFNVKFDRLSYSLLGMTRDPGNMVISESRITYIAFH
jgi:hypothetical protein